MPSRKKHPAIVKIGEHAMGRLIERAGDGWKVEPRKIERLLTALFREQIKLGLARDRHMRFPLLMAKDRFNLEADLLVPLTFPDDERNVWKAATVTYREKTPFPKEKSRLLVGPMPGHVSSAK